MLELRPLCENCGKKLPNESSEAMICSFECTFCHDCVENVLQNVCPNCGGGFAYRPIRPKEKLQKYPAQTEEKVKHVDMMIFESLLIRYKDVKPNER